MIDLTEEQRIAAGLSEAQRRFIAEKRRLLHLPGPWADLYVRLGILKKGAGDWTSTGLAVRKALTGGQDEAI